MKRIWTPTWDIYLSFRGRVERRCGQGGGQRTVTCQILVVPPFSIHVVIQNISEMTLLRNDNNEQVSLISKGVAEIQINIRTAREKPDNTTYTRSLGPYVRLPFVKFIRGRNFSSTLKMKSWFHSDRPAHVIVLGYLILPPTTIIE
jgi:hypothetical protein